MLNQHEYGRKQTFPHCECRCIVCISHVHFAIIQQAFSPHFCIMKNGFSDNKLIWRIKEWKRMNWISMNNVENCESREGTSLVAHVSDNVEILLIMTENGNLWWSSGCGVLHSRYHLFRLNWPGMLTETHNTMMNELMLNSEFFN